MKVIKALKVIRDYCKSNSECHDCIFGQDGCYITEKYPEIWDVEYFEGFSHRKSLQVKIKLVEGGKMPTKAHASDAAFDCYANADMFVKPKNGAVLIPLGFCMELPEGYVAKVVPRSSIGLKTPLRAPHSVGIIDAGYRNEVCMEYECKQGETYEIKKGDRDYLLYTRNLNGKEEKRIHELLNLVVEQTEKAKIPMDEHGFEIESTEYINNMLETLKAEYRNRGYKVKDNE